jgi:hypothetical protein
MNFDNKIIVIDHVLTEEECQSAIQFYNQVSEKIVYEKTFVLHLETDNLWAKKIYNSFSDEKIKNKMIIDWCQIVQWPTNSFQYYHKDTAKSDTVFTSITYLNNDYIGGETSFENDINIIPKIGRTVYFSGQQYNHGVLTVLNGTRYTIPIWYKSI